MKQFYFEAVKKIQFLLLFTVFSVSSVWGQCPSSNITYANVQYLRLSTQAQINNFAVNYPNCTTINTNVLIGVFDLNGTTNITDLSPLANITNITGDLIIRQNPQLVNANLNSLAQIGGDLTLYSNSNQSLATLSLNNLTTIGGKLEVETQSNLNTIGLNNLETIGGSVVVNNTALTSLSLGNVTSLSSVLEITSNANLASLSGLQSLTSINGTLRIRYNHALTSLSGLQNVTSIGGAITIRNSNALTSLLGLQNVTSINGGLVIQDNPALTSLFGLHNITSGINNLIIQQNSNLEMCTLSNLCTYLSNSAATHPRTISGNKTGGSCVSPAAVIISCNTTCTVPTALTVSEGTNSATLGWTSSGNLFDIEWGPQGFALGSGTTVSDITTTSHLLPGLAANTQYQFYVRQDCTVSESNWAGPFGFRTCISGNVTLLTQAQVNAFGATCTTINGHLIIGHNNQTYNTTDITDLSPLAGITHVTGSILIRRNHALTTVNLDALQTIGGTLTVNEENSLTTVSLANLKTVAGISFTVPSLTSLTGLNELETVTGNMSFTGNFGTAFPTFDSLTSIGGNLTFQNITGLTSITGFENLTSITNNFSVSSTSITEVSGFNSLTSLGGIISNHNNNPLTKFELLGTAPITITGNIHFQTNALNTFLSEGFNLRNVTSVGGFIGLVNLSATSVPGFQNLASVGKYLSFLNIPNLSGTLHLGNLTSVGAAGNATEKYINFSNIGASSITGLNLTQIGGYLQFFNTQNLTSVPGLENNLTSVEGYVNVQSTGFSSLSFLQNITSIPNYLHIRDNSSLTSLAALNNLTTINGSLTIRGSGALTSLSGLETITSINGVLTIEQNNALISLSGLQNITSGITELKIWNNSNLEMCELSNLCSYLSNPLATHPRSIGLNKAGGNCVNETAILAVCTPPCNAPTNLMTSGITISSANLNWTSSGNLFDLQWGTSNFELGNGIIEENLNTTSYNLSGLSSDTTYKYYVRQNCDESQSAWAGPFSFTTLPCEIPTNLTASGITISSANLGWTSDGASFDLQWGTSDFELGDGIVVQNLTTTSYSLSGLSYNAAYQFYVRQNCVEANQSDWAGPYAFSTPTFCPPGSYTLRTQNEVNGFLTTNPGCTTITGNLVIGHNNITYGNTNITDLSPLAGITHITGNLIIRRNYNIAEVNLPNLVEVGGDIIITEENQLSSVNFPNLTTIGRHFGLSTLPALETVSGFNNLVTVGGYINFERIRQTSPAPTPNSLVLPSFTNLQSIGGNLRFLNIYGLNTYTNAFPNLQSIGGTFQVSINGIGPSSLEVFKGFNSLTSIGKIDFSTNQSGLQTFEILGTAPITVTGDVHFNFNNFPVFAINTLHLGNITSVGGKAHFRNVAADFTGFNPTSIGDYLYIHNSGLTSVSGFSNLTSIGGKLHLQYIPSLTSVTAFENLTSVAGELQIRQMGALASLEGLQNIDPSGITNLIFHNNGQLTTCDLANLCTYLSNPNNPRTILNNKTGGGCANDAVLMNICVPPCYEPIGLSATNLTANTATLGWSTSEDFDLEWGTGGFTLGNGTTIAGNGNSHNLSGLNPSTQYEFYVRQSCSANNQSDWAGPFAFTTQGYCIPSPYVASQTNGIYINSFSIILGVENINNTNSGFSSGGYGDFSSLSASQHIGESIQFTMTPGSDSNAQGMKIWADWNNNGVFEASEVVYTSQDATIGTQSGHFIVPNVAEGNYRMRVMIKYNSTNIDPCETTFYGEAEDYSFTVLPVSACPSPTTITASTIGINTADFNWSSITNAQNYNWIVVTAGANPISTNVTSGNTTGTTASVSGLSMETAYDFYVKSDCDTTGQSNWSVPFRFTTQGSPYRFVKTVASGTGDGSSWANASDDLQKMINATATVEVWVASGTYQPIRPANDLNIIDQENQDNAFVLKNNVKVYGGFAGTETTLDQRDFSQNISILSGDFNNNGIADNDDAYHVVVIAGNLGTATLDGFTVTGGNATGSGNIVVNSRNISRAHSGGINIVQSSIGLRNLVVTNNNGQYGGGIFLIESPASLKDSKITNNTSQSGAGIKFDSSALALTNVVITGNQASTYGGGIDIYGTPSPTLTNVTVSGNVAEAGGGICTNLSSPIIRNSVVYGNNTGLVNLTPSYAVTYSNSLVEGVTTASNGNIDGSTDPLFNDMPDYNTAPFAGGDYTLQMCSPIINKGNNTHIAGNNSDITGSSRIYGGTVDLGAYETQQGSTAPTNLYASGLHTTTVTLGWESDSDLFDIEWGVQGFTQGSGTLVSGLTVNSYTLTNLTFDTIYEFYVREKCGGNQSEWSAPFTFTPVYSICPLGYLAFTSQAQINAFGVNYSTCNVTTGHLVISGNDITNLTPLANIIQVGGHLHVHNNLMLQNFNGLHNIKSVGGIRIHDNTALTSMAALTLNEQVDGVLNGYFLIERNPALVSLDGLESITEITNYLRIHDNASLADMGALNGMTGIGTSTATTLTYRGVSIHGTAITALPDWSLMTQINQELNISDNPNLTSLHGLHNITSVATYLRIHNNGVTNLDALSNLNSINGNLTLHGPSLLSASGLSGLSGNINGQLMIDHTGLTTLDGLQNITSLAGQLFIRSNPNLTTLDALANIDANSIASLTIRDNASLTDCSIDSLCEYLSNNSATHPRYIVNNSGACLNLAAVIAACPAPVVCPTGILTFNTQAQLDQFKIDYPNCTEISGQLRIMGGLNITNLDGLSNIEKINGGFIIWGNHNLHSLEGLENLTAIASTLTIYNNTNLKNVDALSNLTSLGVGLGPILTSGAAHLIIQHNRDLENLDGLSNLTKFGGDITIENNLSLENIDGLASITTGNTPNLLPNVVKSISLRNNASLVNIDALSHITRIGYLYVIGNGSLENLNGLSNVTQAVGSISIINNTVLNDISGLGNLNINLIFGNQAGYNTGLGVVIVNNPTLSVCNLPTNLCTYLAGPKRRNISGNLPGCANEQAAINACNSCEIPMNPIANTVTPYDAAFSWTAVDNASAYNWIIVGDNQDPDTATPLFSGTVTQTTVSVSSLEPNTHYDFYLRTDCSSNDSSWSARVDFFTEIICPSGNVFLTTQAEVNAFPTTYIGCSAISGNLIIGGIYAMSNISDLSPLNGITQVGGNLIIQNINTGLVNLNGLEALSQVGGNIDVYNNIGLTSLSGLEGLTATTGYLSVVYNSALTSLSGLHNVTTVGDHLTVFGNHALTNLNGLSGISSTGNYLNIGYNNGLTSLTGFGNAQVTLGGSLDVRHNTSLVSLNGLQTITSLGSDLRIWDNTTLENLDALSNITSINGYIHIQTNPELEDISGLENIDPATIGGTLGLHIQDNQSLSVCGLDNFCMYLLNPANIRTIVNNGEDCTEEAVTVECTPVCDIPENVSATSVDTTTANLSWSGANGANGYTWVIMPSGVNPDGTPIASGTTLGTTVALSELTSTTAYDFYVKANCSLINSDWSEVVRFMTYSPDYAAVALTGFNTDVIAEGTLSPAVSTSAAVDVNYQNVFYNQTYSYNWVVSPQNYLPANGAFTSEQTAGLPYQLAPANGNNALRLTNGQSGTLTFETPVTAKTVFALITSGEGVSMVNVTVNFEDNTIQQFNNHFVADWFNGNNYAITGLGRVERSGYNFQDFSDNPRLYEMELAISSENQDKNITGIHFQRTSGGIAVTAVMGVSIEKGVLPCLEPTDLGALNITENSADLGWTSDGSLFVIEWGVLGFTQGSGTMVSDLEITTHNLSGLSANTQYEFYVRQNCTVNQSVWVGPFTFTTLSICSEPADLTASNITENNADLGWTSDGSLFDVEWGVSGFTQGSGTVVNDLATITHNLSGLSANTQYEFYVRQNCTVNQSIWVGPFTFTTLSICSAPTDLAVSNLTENSTTLSWTSDGSLFDVEWGVLGFTQGSGTMVNDLLTNTHNLSGLSANTQYEFYVRQNCTVNESEWAGPFTFTTLSICSAPTDLAVSNLTENSTILSWTSDGSLFDVEWGVSGFTQGSGTMVNDLATITHNLSGLSANTQYEFYVRQDCIVNESVWTGPFGFTTLEEELSQFSPVTLSGFNHDVIAEGSQIPTTTTTIGIDGSGNSDYVFINGTYSYNNVTPTRYLPSNGYFISEQTTDLPYQLAPADQNNSLRLEYGQSGMLSFSTQVVAKSIYVLATSGAGSSQLTVTVNFDDSTSEQFTGVEVSDWWNASGYALKGIGRIARGGYSLEMNLETIRLYEKQFVLSATNQEKNIVSVSFQRTGGSGIANIMGISIENGIIPTCPTPTALTVTNLTANSIDFVWNASANSNGYEWMIVADGADPNTSTPLYFGNTTQTEVSVSGLTQNTAYDFYVKSDCGTTDGYSNWIKADFTTLELCSTPTDLAVSNLTIDSVTLSWTSTGTLFDIEFGPSGFIPTGIPSEDLTGVSNLYTLTGLTADTNYQYYVRQNCGVDGTSNWAGPFTFYTGHCTSTAIYTGYRILGFSTTDGYANITNENNGVANSYNNYSNMAVAQSAGETFNVNITVPGYTLVEIWVDFNQDLIFDIDTERVATFTSYGTSISNVFTGTITIPNGTPVGDYRMRVRSHYYWNLSTPCGTTNYGETEDYTVSVVETPSCLSPTDLAVSNLTLDSAIISWSSTGTLFDVEWGVAGFTQGSGTQDVVANQTSYNLSDLTAGVTYDFYVRQDCNALSDGYSNWIKHTFSTNNYCVPVLYTDYGIIQGFTTMGGVTNINNINSGISVNGYGNFSVAYSVGQNAGESLSFSVVQGAGNWGSGYESGLRIFVDWNKDGVFDVSEAVYTSPNQITGTHNGSFGIPADKQGNYRMRVILALWTNGSDILPCTQWQYYGETEDYTLTVLQPTCPIPTALTVTNLTVNSIDFVWNASANSNGYEWMIVADGADPNTSTPLYFGNTTQTEVSVSGLEQTTAYDFYVKSDCGTTDGYSNWIKADFTTLELCSTPTDLTVSNLTIDSATLSWLSAGTLFDIEFGFNGFTPTGTPSVPGVTNPYVLTLPTSGSYQYYVRQDCDTDGTSLWAGPFNFTIGFYDGEIPTQSNLNPTVTSTDYCTPDPIITIVVPNGMQIAGLNVVYNMTAMNGAWMSEQRSFIYSPTLGMGETTLVQGSGGVAGTMNYSRSMDFANGATGTVEFTLRAWRTWGGSGCSTYYNKVDSGTWTIIPTFETFTNCAASTTWTGTSWSNGEPDATTKAIIDGVLTLTSDLTACELEITANGSLVIPTNRTFTVKGQVVNNSNADDFVIANNGILLQIDDVENQGAITVERESSPMYRLDYTIWSSPVSGMLLRDFSNVSIAGGSGTLWNRVYTLGDNVWNQVWSSQQSFESDYTSTFTKAKGYMYRAKNVWVTRNSGNPAEADLGVFTGVPNNGTISINTPLMFNAIGNPYPSPINGDDLLGTGATALYFWTNANTPDASGTYQLNNWAYYNQVGGTGVQIGGLGDQIQVPNGIIQPGQGFVIGTTGDVNQITFNNEMRMNNNGMFFRQMSNERHRFWLNLSDEMAVYNQILVGYMENATQGVDTGMDATMFAYEGNAIYSLINNDQEQYVVQGRELPFTDSDVVKLGFRAIQSGSYNISLNNFDGIFEQENLIIYLKDNFSQTQHNLKDGAYTFVSEEGLFDNRFEVVYQTTMSTDNPISTDANWIVYRQDKGFQVQTIGFEMKEVSVYDMLGRRVYTSQAEGQTHQIPNLGAEGVYIVKVTTTEDKVLNRKTK